MVMARWEDRWLAGEAGPPVLYRHHACGRIGHVDPRCSQCGEPMHADDVDLLPGPGLSGRFIPLFHPRLTDWRWFRFRVSSGWMRR
jgi:hypothetical protein